MTSESYTIKKLFYGGQDVVAAPRISLVTLAVASLPFCVLLASENSFTFQTAIPPIALMGLAFLLTPATHNYSKHAAVVMLGIIGVIGISNRITAMTYGYILNYFLTKDLGLSGDSSVTTHGTITDFLVDFGVVGLGLFFYKIFYSVQKLIRSKRYFLAAVLPWIFICLIIIRAERTVALWLYLILFVVLGNYFVSHPDKSLYTVFSDEEV